MYVSYISQWGTFQENYIMESDSLAVSIFQKLSEHEALIGRLYLAYADLFEASEAFFRQLQKEECEHSRLFSQIQNMLEDGKLKVLSINPNIQILIDSSINFIRKQILKAEAKNLTPEYALSIAEKIESSIFESKLFDYIKTDSKEITDALLKFATESMDHFDAIAGFRESKASNTENSLT